MIFHINLRKLPSQYGEVSVMELIFCGGVSCLPAALLLLNILKTNGPIKTKFCIHIIIDKIDVGIVNRCFSQICNRVTALD